VNLLGILLACAAVGAGLAGIAALVCLAAVGLVGGRQPGTRADVAFVAALTPAFVVVVALGAALSPSALLALGFDVVDHCPAHVHHPHLCVLHFTGLTPTGAVLGAAAIAIFGVRAALLAGRHLRMATSIARLERMGTRQTDGRFPLVRLPGSARLCHAVGIFEKRVLVSTVVADGLSEEAWRAVRAHEEEHLARRDPLASLLVEVGLLFVPPFLSGALGAAFRRAAEAACDAAAARRLGDGVKIAEGLLQAARLLGATPSVLPAPAAAAAPLEDRVRELLERPLARGRPSFAFAAAAALLFVLLALAVVEAGSIHHALETLLFHLA
jgi:hypothetical protein